MFTGLSVTASLAVWLSDFGCLARRAGCRVVFERKQFLPEGFHLRSVTCMPFRRSCGLTRASTRSLRTLPRHIRPCDLDPSKFESAARIVAAASRVRTLEPELDLAGCGSKRPQRHPEAMDRGHHPASGNHFDRSPRFVWIGPPDYPAWTIGPDGQPVLGPDRDDGRANVQISVWGTMA
jgi:hypothetical protein